MATIAEVTVPAADFALHEAFGRIPALTVGIEPSREHDVGQMLPFAWISATTSDDDIEAALDADPSVDGFARLAALDDARFYRLDWAEAVRTLVRALTEEGGSVLAAGGRDDCWTLRLLFAEREMLARAYDRSTTLGVRVDVTRIYRSTTETRAR